MARLQLMAGCSEGSETARMGRWERGPSFCGPMETAPKTSSATREELARRRRYGQLRHAEERLRPLRETRLARLYWQVHEELNRLGRELHREVPERGHPVDNDGTQTVC